MQHGDREAHYFADENRIEAWEFCAPGVWIRHPADVIGDWEDYSYHRYPSRPATWMGNDKINPMPRTKI